MATLGHEVVGIDTDMAKIDALAAGDAPFYEPGLPELLEEALATGRLKFSSDIADVQWVRRALHLRRHAPAAG